MGTGALEMPLRRLLATLARSPATRFVGRPPERPHHWFPGKVPDADGCGMTDPAAWELIAECLEDSRQAMESLTLNVPPGANGYVMKVALPHLQDRIYIKFELLVPCDGRKICGRSFHFEDPR